MVETKKSPREVHVPSKQEPHQKKRRSGNGGGSGTGSYIPSGEYREPIVYPVRVWPDQDRYLEECAKEKFTTKQALVQSFVSDKLPPGPRK